MTNETPNFTDAPIRGDVVAEHDCPACGAVVEQIYRPGRHRVYCTNACRQRAYRWRRTHGVRMCVERTGPAESLYNRRWHARRLDADPASSVRDRRERELTACGTFAMPLRNRRRTHHQFVPESPNSCESCIGLVGVGPYGSGIPDVVRKFWPSTDRPRW